MPDDLLALILIEEALAARERRLWIEEQRRFLRVEMIRRLILSLATLVVAALAVAGVGIVLPR